MGTILSTDRAPALDGASLLSLSPRTGPPAPTVTASARAESARSTSKDSSRSDLTELAASRDPAQQLDPLDSHSAAARAAADLREEADRLVCGSNAQPRLDHTAVVGHLMPAIVSDSACPSAMPYGETRHILMFAIPVPCEFDPAVHSTAFLCSAGPDIASTDPRRFGLFPAAGDAAELT